MIFQQQRLLANNVLHDMYDTRLASPRKSPISFGNVCMRSLDAVGAISSLTEKSSHTIFMNFNYPNIPFFPVNSQIGNSGVFQGKKCRRTRTGGQGNVFKDTLR